MIEVPKVTKNSYVGILGCSGVEPHFEWIEIDCFYIQYWNYLMFSSKKNRNTKITIGMLLSISRIADCAVDTHRLNKELRESASLWRRTGAPATSREQRDRIYDWSVVSENYTVNIPSGVSPYKDVETNALIRALNNTPFYKGILYRIDGSPGFTNGFISEGDTVITTRLLSFSSSLEFVKSFSLGRKVFFVLEAVSTARNISNFNPSQAESIIEIGSTFMIEKILKTQKTI